jgi:DNA primase
MEASDKPQGHGEQTLAKADNSPYDKFAEEVFSLDSSESAKASDQDVIVARVVEKLKAKYPDMPEQPLFNKARDLYWQWKDSRSGEEEFKSTDMSME